MGFDINKIIEDTRDSGSCKYANTEFLVELTKSIKRLYPDAIIGNNPLHDHYLIKVEENYFYITMIKVDATEQKTSSMPRTNHSSVPYGCTGMLCTFKPVAVNLEVEANKKVEECKKELRKIKAKVGDIAYLVVFSNSSSISERKAVVNGKQLTWSPMQTKNRNMSCFEYYMYSVVEVTI